MSLENLEKFQELLLTYLIKVKEIYNQGDSTEISYRTCFENFLRSIFPPEYEIQHEPKAKTANSSNYSASKIDPSSHEKPELARPDFVIKKNGFIVGYIETKALDAGYFREIEKSAQIKKYLSINENILATNYFNFTHIQIIKNNHQEEKTTTTKQGFGSPKDFLPIDAKKEDIFKLQSIFKTFLNQEPKLIGKPKDLAKKLANISKILQEYLKEELLAEKQEEKGELYGIYISFRNNLSESMEMEDFVDAFAQMVAYSLFLAKLNLTGEDKLTLDNVHNYINTNFTLVAELVQYLRVLTNNSRLSSKAKWLIDELFLVVNHIDAFSIGEELAYNKQKNNIADPYLYFYEDFLHEYDKDTKQNRGVYYTPPEVVNYIVKSTSLILQQELNLSEGFANEKVKTLDFATGTGTFILAVYKEILANIDSNSAKIKPLIQEVILQNIYGFEYLMAPYAICHLKLSEYLKSFNYQMAKDEKIPVYLTNTLSNLTPQANLLLPSLSEEGEKAHKIKKDENIMVIIGNPPYNAKSKNPTTEKIVGENGKFKAVNNYIGELLQQYKPVGETNIKPLNDDYIKFIAFAVDKLKKQTKGVLAVIVNNSFINGLTHRKLRNALLNEFASIYILNLHGDSRKKETAPDGTKDENVFNIMQGVAIALFIKKPQKDQECQVYYYDLFGSRKEKYQFLANHNYQNTAWQKLDVYDFNQKFNQSQWANLQVEKSNLSKQNQKSLAEGLFAEEDFAQKNKQQDYVTTKRFQEDLSFFIPINQDGILNYGTSIGITEIFSRLDSGLVSHRDSIALQHTKQEMLEIINDFIILPKDKLKKKYNIKDDTRDWILNNAIQSISANNGIIKSILVLPFDTGYTYYNKKVKGFLSYPRYDLLKHFFCKNIGISFIRKEDNVSNYNYTFVHKEIIPKTFLSGQTYTAPLYLTATVQETVEAKTLKTRIDYQQVTRRYLAKDNFSSYFKEYIKKLYNLDISFTGELYQEENPNQENIANVFGYIYALMYSIPYKQKYLEYLKIDFPRIIFPKDYNLFLAIAQEGKKLVACTL